VPTGIEPDADRPLVEHRHPEHRTAISLPPTWTVRLDEPEGVALLGIETETDPWGFRTNLVITVENLDRGTNLHSWQAGATKLLPEALTDFLLLDLQPANVGECPGLRRLAHHDADGRAVTMEQWATIDGDRGLTLTASVSTLAYAGLAGQLAAIAGTFRVAAHLTQSQTADDG
jgi:hypothetical protein